MRIKKETDAKPYVIQEKLKKRKVNSFEKRASKRTDRMDARKEKKEPQKKRSQGEPGALEILNYAPRSWKVQTAPG